MTEQRFLRLLLYIALFCALTVLFFRFLLPVLLPFLIGLLLASLAEPAVRLLRQRWRAPRGLASGLVMTFLGEASTNWGYMMAASIVAAVPVTVIFVFLQRYFIQGLTAGAVKG